MKTLTLFPLFWGNEKDKIFDLFLKDNSIFNHDKTHLWMTMFTTKSFCLTV